MLYIKYIKYLLKKSVKRYHPSEAERQLLKKNSQNYTVHKSLLPKLV